MLKAIDLSWSHVGAHLVTRVGRLAGGLCFSVITQESSQSLTYSFRQEKEFLREFCTERVPWA